MKISASNPVNTKRHMDVDLTSFERYGRQMNVKITLCAYWYCINVTFNVFFILIFYSVLFMG